MANADFNWVNILHNFTVNNPSATKTFPIEGTRAPVDDGYLLIQVKGVTTSSHKIYINDKELPGTDLQPTQSTASRPETYMLWMDRIPPGYLKLGNNTIRIERAANDDFYVRSLVVNWRE